MVITHADTGDSGASGSGDAQHSAGAESGEGSMAVDVPVQNGSHETDGISIPQTMCYFTEGDDTLS